MIFKPPDLQFIRFKSRFRVLSNGEFPPFPGSLIRGCFGIALKNIVCLNTSQNCDLCKIRENCSYDILFHSPPLSPKPRFTHYTRYPHPYVIEPFLQIHSVDPGQSLEITMILMGKAISSLAFIIRALENMGKAGLGSSRTQLRLEEVTDEYAPVSEFTPVVFDGRNQAFTTSPKIGILSDIPYGIATRQAVTIDFRTPFRSREFQQWASTLQFETLMRIIIRRLSMLNEIHGDSGWEPPYFEIFEKSNTVQTVDSRIEWKDWNRFSKASGNKVYMGGWTGEIDFEGDLSVFMLLLKAAEILHIGRGTTFGNGRVVVK